MNEPTPPDADRRRILVVDDDPGTVQAARDWFARQPYEILSASNGEQGLRLAVDGEPDIILLDLKMPGLDGISVARRLKSDSRTRAIPVILLTACRDTDSKVEAFAAGADDYVTKPFEFEEIDARVRSMLRRGQMLTGLQSRVRDLTSTKEELEQLLTLDEKTGLYNFREFQRRLRQEWQRARRYDVPLSLVMLDLDHFKRVNAAPTTSPHATAARSSRSSCPTPTPRWPSASPSASAAPSPSSCSWRTSTRRV
jgi:PleD family two-component response regulator